MEFQAGHLFTLMVSLITIAFVSSIPIGSDVLQGGSGLELDKRPKYMDTRRDLDVFKDLVLLSIQELVDEKKINPAVLSSDDSPKSVAKRMKYMGICMRKQYNSFIPYPCLRSGR